MRKTACILYKPGPQFIANLSSRETKIRNEETLQIDISINAIEACTNIPECFEAEEIWFTNINDEHIGILLDYIMYGWPLINRKYKKKHNHTGYLETK